MWRTMTKRLCATYGTRRDSESALRQIGTSALDELARNKYGTTHVFLKPAVARSSRQMRESGV